MAELVAEKQAPSPHRLRWMMLLYGALSCVLLSWALTRKEVLVGRYRSWDLAQSVIIPNIVSFLGDIYPESLNHLPVLIDRFFRLEVAQNMWLLALLTAVSQACHLCGLRNVQLIRMIWSVAGIYWISTRYLGGSIFVFVLLPTFFAAFRLCQAVSSVLFAKRLFSLITIVVSGILFYKMSIYNSQVRAGLQPDIAILNSEAMLPVTVKDFFTSLQLLRLGLSTALVYAPMRLISFISDTSRVHWQDQQQQLSITASFIAFTAYMLYPVIGTFHQGPLVTYHEFLQLTSQRQGTNWWRCLLQVRRFLAYAVLLWVTLTCVPYYYIIHYGQENFRNDLYYDMYYLESFFVVLASITYIATEKVMHSCLVVVGGELCGLPWPETLAGCPYVIVDFQTFWRNWNTGWHTWTISYVVAPLRDKLQLWMPRIPATLTTSVVIGIAFGFSVITHTISGRQGWVQAGLLVVLVLTIESRLGRSFNSSSSMPRLLWQGCKWTLLIYLIEYMNTTGFALEVLQRAPWPGWLSALGQGAVIVLIMTLHVFVSCYYSDTARGRQNLLHYKERLRGVLSKQKSQ
jgi:hypothetical protein